MRIIAALLALAASAGIGAAASAGLNARKKLMQALCSDARAICDRMELTSGRLCDMLSKLPNESTRALWQGFADSLGRHEPAAELWKKCVNEQRSDSLRRLKDEDIASLKALGEAFAAAGRQAQLNRMKLAINELEARHMEAGEDAKRKGKLYSSLGVLTGFAAAIMIV